MQIKNKEVKNCVYDRLYDEMVEMVRIDNEDSGLKGATARLANHYLSKIEKIKNEVNTDDDEWLEVVDNLIDEFYFEKLPLIIEAFGLDSKNYLNLLEQEIQNHIKDCETEIEEDEENEETDEKVLYEDEDLRVVLRNGVKTVEYKTNSFDIPEDHPLYKIVESFFRIA
jgi:hypothetical protein